MLITTTEIMGKGVKGEQASAKTEAHQKHKNRCPGADVVGEANIPHSPVCVLTVVFYDRARVSWLGL